MFKKLEEWGNAIKWMSRGEQLSKLFPITAAASITASNEIKDAATHIVDKTPDTIAKITDDPEGTIKSFFAETARRKHENISANKFKALIAENSVSTLSFKPATITGEISARASVIGADGQENYSYSTTFLPNTDLDKITENFNGEIYNKPSELSGLITFATMLAAIGLPFYMLGDRKLSQWIDKKFPEKTKQPSPEDQKTIAIHEAGHAIMGLINEHNGLSRKPYGMHPS